MFSTHKTKGFFLTTTCLFSLLKASVPSLSKIKDGQINWTEFARNLASTWIYVKKETNTSEEKVDTFLGLERLWQNKATRLLSHKGPYKS